MEKPQKTSETAGAAPARPERINAEAEALRANLGKRKRQHRLRQFEESGKDNKGNAPQEEK